MSRSRLAAVLAPLPGPLRKEVEHYLRTGQHDNFLFDGWPGSFIERARQGHAVLIEALIAEVRRRAPRARTLAALRGLDVEAYAAGRLEPMVRGLFRRAEQPVVLDLLARSVVFLTPDNVEATLRASRWTRTAWNLATVHLASVGAEPLSAEAAGLVGLSEETTCYVSMKYLETTDRFADFVVHEAAHVFHNCKRETVGLRHTRRREWLLEIDYSKRELFAYCCEAYSRLLELARRPAERRALFADLEREPAPVGPAEAEEYVDVLREAVCARNGWKRILARCAPDGSRERAR